MYSLTLLLFIVVESITSDWIEIKQVSSQKFDEESTILNNYKTTPVPYEVFMKTPQDNFEYTYTTPLNYKDAHDGNEILRRTTLKTDFSTSRNILKENLPHKTKNTTKNGFQSTRGKKKEKNKNKSTLNSQGFLSFLNNIQQHLLEYKNKTIKNKISILQQLRDNMLLNIEDRISDFWVYEKSSGEARTYKEDDDHHMEFPSNEGALMTIGFLTFAVFLIKLVLKLIYALKYKQYIASTAASTGGTVTIIGRKKRDLTDDDIRLLKLIEEYKFA